MDELFSCRNCVHNAGQSLNVGRGHGYCLFHSSVLQSPSGTTCKYLHRKDLPRFTVDEGISEHAGEFAMLAGPAELNSKKPVAILPYSERYSWEHEEFDPLLNALAQYHKAQRSWIFIQALSGGLDGLRSLAHASMIRRYMDRCNKWTSSYRLVLAMVQELDAEPRFDERSLMTDHGLDLEEARSQALWDVIFSRLSGLQEYGWHSGLENLIWISDRLNGGLTELNWDELKPELTAARPKITEEIINHAKENNGFFTQPMERETEPEFEAY